MPDHRSTVVVNSGQWWWTTGQQWLTACQRWTTWRPTSACRSHVSPRGTATLADWVPHAYVAATSAADVAEGILILLQNKKNKDPAIKELDELKDRINIIEEILSKFGENKEKQKDDEPSLDPDTFL
ncbi:hypothetical protein Tco_1230563, partial [Tanacetum coccineum]